MDKFFAIMDVCREIGIHTTPALVPSRQSEYIRRTPLAVHAANGLFAAGNRYRGVDRSTPKLVHTGPCRRFRTLSVREVSVGITRQLIVLPRNGHQRILNSKHFSVCVCARHLIRSARGPPELAIRETLTIRWQIASRSFSHP